MPNIRTALALVALALVALACHSPATIEDELRFEAPIAAPASPEIGLCDTSASLGGSTYGEGCGTERRYPLTLARDTPADEVEHIRAAARLWEDAVGVDFGGLPLADEPTLVQDPIGAFPVPGVVICRANIAAFNVPNGRLYRAVLAHELGHYLGLPDSDDGLMNARRKSHSALELTDADVELYEAQCVGG